eukprot:2947301-Pyramimonas_sp.AAC.1
MPGSRTGHAARSGTHAHGASLLASQSFSCSSTSFSAMAMGRTGTTGPRHGAGSGLTLTSVRY